LVLAQHQGKLINTKICHYHKIRLKQVTLKTIF
jgi:hypothetical protein